MADHVVIFDPNLEIGAIVDTDTMRAIGPVGVGPNAQAELQQFVERMPPSVLERMSSYELTTAYMEWWNDNFAALYAEPAAGDTPAMVANDGASDDGARLAEHEARTATDTPPPQPADTDMEADQGQAPDVGQDAQGATETAEDNGAEPPPYEGPCFACEGSGRVPGAAAGEQVACNLCQGTGQLPAPVAS